MRQGPLPDFDALQKAVHSDPYAMILGAFDIMHLDGHDLRDVGCKARREILFGIIQPNSSARWYPAIRRPSSISPTKRGWRGSFPSAPTAHIGAAPDMKERLWKRVKDHAGPLRRASRSDRRPWVEPA
ncbi:hypothetical protein NKH98_29455 [Mesorhizobium sp. M0833]|uniref:hypothetical protein n=1 Tax=Mesorhizobium sp. M0833 TaxID=2957009 RepID=UPI003338358F